MRGKDRWEDGPGVPRPQPAPVEAGTPVGDGPSLAFLFAGFSGAAGLGSFLRGLAGRGT